MHDTVRRLWEEILARPEGPLALRFYLQPTVAILLALRDGLRDAREGQPAYLWALFTRASERRALVRSGWQSVGKVFVIAFALDVVYQLVVLHGLRPIQGLLIALTLAIVPYALLRGPANRLARGLGARRAREA